MSDTYLYAIVADGRGVRPGYTGLPDGRSRVRALLGEGLAALVSTIHGPSVAALPRTELMRCLTLHQEVIEVAMRAGPLLPVKFGTLLDSPEEALALLARWRGRLMAGLEQVGDAVEIEVAATWDLQRALAEIGREPQLAALKARAAGQSPEDLLSTRILVGKLVKEELDRRRSLYRRFVLDELAPCARDVQPNPLLADELVLNVAFLVERSRQERFYAAVERVDAAFENRLNFRCIGPLPPYSFASVEITRPRRERIEALGRLLELDEQASEQEVNAAYRRLAARCHPDHNPGDPSAEARFAALASAHAELLDYIRGQRAGGRPEGPGHRYHVRGAEVNAALRVEVRRSGPEPGASEEASRERSAVAV